MYVPMCFGQKIVMSAGTPEKVPGRLGTWLNFALRAFGLTLAAVLAYMKVGEFYVLIVAAVSMGGPETAMILAKRFGFKK